MVFGRVPRVPGELLTSDTSLIENEETQKFGERYVTSEIIRAEAIKAVAEFQVDAEIKRAIFRRAVKLRPDGIDLMPGQPVAFWRENIRNRGTRRGGYVLGNFIAYDPRSSASAWVESGGRLRLVSREQLRAAAGFEQWTPTQADVESLRRAERQLREGRGQDERDLPPEPADELGMNIVLPPPPTPVPAPGTPMPSSLALVPPRRVSFETSLLPLPGAASGSTELPGLPRQPELPSASDDGLGLSLIEPIDIDTTAPPKRELDQAEDGTDEPAPRRPRLEPEGPSTSALLSLPDGSARLFGNLAWDGTQDEATLGHSTFFADLLDGLYHKEDNHYQRYGAYGDDGVYDEDIDDVFEVHAAENVADTDSQDTDYQAPDTLSRREQRALDRELPWREIYRAPDDYRLGFVAAIKKEFDSWMKFDSAEPLDKKEANKVFQDANKAKRILRSRMVYRDKNLGQPPLRAKARCVVLGCSDPDLRDLDRDSPTPTRLSFLIVVQLYASGVNRKVGTGGHKWRLLAADAEAAFLQGDASAGRPGDIWMKPPADPLVKESGCFDAPLYRLTSTVYGLANAPRAWTRRVSEKLNEAGFQNHSLDRMMWMHYCVDTKTSSEPVLDAVVIFHVDDMLTAFSELFDIEILLGLFRWGNITEAPAVLKYCGKQITTLETEAGIVVRVDQADYVKATKVGKVSRERLRGPPALTPEERTEYRSVTGSLQWLSSSTRPDLAASTSLLQSGSPTIEDLRKLNSVLAYAHATSTVGLCYTGIALNQETEVIAFGDASWANAAGGRSQMGYMVFLAGSDIEKGAGRASLLDWRSCRTKRVVRSTIAAEACAADAAVDHGYFLAVSLAEVLTGEAIGHGGTSLRLRLATDCRSLYDALIRENPTLEEKRVLIDVRAIQAQIHKVFVHWVPTDAQPADVLTKVSDMLIQRCTDWLGDIVIRLHD